MKKFISPCVGCLSIIAICWIFQDISNLYIRFSCKVIISVIIYALVEIIMKNEQLSSYEVKTILICYLFIIH